MDNNEVIQELEDAEDKSVLFYGCYLPPLTDEILLVRYKSAD